MPAHVRAHLLSHGPGHGAYLVAVQGGVHLYEDEEAMLQEIQHHRVLERFLQDGRLNGATERIVQLLAEQLGRYAGLQETT